jgi:hypothetical protein
MYEADVVDIMDPVTDEVVNHCLGPTAAGSCPLTGVNGIVLCNGCRVAAPSAGPEYWNIWVPPASQHCPRAWHLEAIGY